MKSFDITNLRYAPDADPTQPGVLTGVSFAVPTVRGSYRAAWGAGTAGYGVTSSVPIVGAAILKWADGTVHIYAGSSTRIKEADGVNSWTDRSAGGIAYTTAASWQFAAYGSATLATSLANTLQVSTGAAFAAVATAPKAQCIAVMANAVMCGNYNSIPDGWISSDVGDYTNWTATAANAVANGRLLDTPGPINAMATLNDQVIAWKSRGMYVGRFVGSPTQWAWQLLSADVGCTGPDAWVHTDIGIVFASERDVFLYDGGSLRSIADGVIRKTLFAGLTNFTETRLTYEPAQSLVYVFTKRGTSGTAGSDNAYAWNHACNKWGEVGASGTGSFGNISYTFVQAVVRNPNYLDMTGKAFTTNSYSNAAMVFSSEGEPLIFYLDAPYTDLNLPNLITGSAGDLGQKVTVSRVDPRYLTASGTTDTMNLSYGINGLLASDGSVAMNFDATRKRFDGVATGQVFALSHLISNAAEISGYRVFYTPAGPE